MELTLYVVDCGPNMGAKLISHIPKWNELRKNKGYEDRSQMILYLFVGNYYNCKYYYHDW